MRTKLIEATIVLLRQRGFGGLRTGEVSDLAGVSRGAQLHHFPSKHELIMATIRYMNDRIVTESRRRAAAAGETADPLDGLIGDAMDFFFSDYFFVSLAIAMGDARDEDLRRQTFPLSRENRFAVEKAWLEALVRHGVPEKAAADIVALTLSIVRGFSVRAFIDDNRPRFDALLETWKAMVAAYLEKHFATAAMRAAATD